MSHLCKFCESVWLIRSPDGKLVLEDGSKHDCPKAPWNLNIKNRARARAVKKSELKKIDDHAILLEIRDKVRHWNSRLANYVLDLHVIRKHPEGEEA
jgi:hypothetical protein